MEQVLPEEVSAAEARAARKRRGARHSVVAGGVRLPILELKPGGFVIEADRRPRLPGFVDIMDGETRLARRLVVCAWAEHGLIGYEFKQENLAAPVATDHAPADPRGETEPGPA